MSRPIAWTIAGSDSGGGAGIQADLKTFHSLGVHGCSAITAITAQNTQGISGIHHVPEDYLAKQITSLKTDLPAKAVKIGMLGTYAAVKELHSFLQNYCGTVILDPVMVATSGNALISVDVKGYRTALQTIFPFVDLFTPNIPEAETILDRRLRTYDDIKQAADDILALGVKSVLIKGGHFTQGQFSQDYWTNGQQSFWLACEKRGKHSVHGTGCTLSSAITACMALGYELRDALVIAKMYVSQAIRLANSYGAGADIITHAHWPENSVDLPYLSDKAFEQHAPKFSDCGSTPLGLYPIVDESFYLSQLLPLGVTTIQLRIKNKTSTALEDEIKQSIALAKQFGARLFINDYWELAIRHGAYGVHLGQEDLNAADVKKIQQAGLRLGISTHCYYEVARAHSFRPSYLACGPIYPTTSKIMPFAPQGTEQLQRWCRTLPYPLVAIGGINLQRLPEILATKVDGIAMISAITQAENPQVMTQQLLDVF